MGNYNSVVKRINEFAIIPLQEKMGNYNARRLGDSIGSIIPLQEKMGNYRAVPIEYHTF
jgi:hypothetical protein